MFSIYRMIMGSQKISFHITLCSQVLNLRKKIARVLVLAIFVLEPKMIMSHQADLVDGCGAGGRPSDYLSASFQKAPHSVSLKHMLRY